jgi:hypothetical protein
VRIMSVFRGRTGAASYMMKKCSSAAWGERCLKRGVVMEMELCVPMDDS